MSIRKGDVTGIVPAGQPGLVQGTMGIGYHDGGASLPLPRWFLGNVKSGFHVGAAPNDQVVVLSWGPGDKPTAVVPFTDHPEEMDLLPANEPVIYAPDGSFLLHARTDGSLTIATPGGASIAADAAGNVTVTPKAGGTVALSGPTTVTSLSVNGATLGANKLAVTGDTTVTGRVFEAPSGATSFARNTTNFSAATLTGNDAHGEIALTTAASLNALDYQIGTLTFATAYPSTPQVFLTIDSTSAGTSAFCIPNVKSRGTGSVQLYLTVPSATTVPNASSFIIQYRVQG